MRPSQHDPRLRGSWTRRRPYACSAAEKDSSSSCTDCAVRQAKAPRGDACGTQAASVVRPIGPAALGAGKRGRLSRVLGMNKLPLSLRSVRAFLQVSDHLHAGHCDPQPREKKIETEVPTREIKTTVATPKLETKVVTTGTGIALNVRSAGAKMLGATGVVILTLFSGVIGAAINEKYFSDPDKAQLAFSLSDTLLGCAQWKRYASSTVQSFSRSTTRRVLRRLTPTKQRADTRYEAEEWDGRRAGVTTKFLLCCGPRLRRRTEVWPRAALVCGGPPQ